MLPHEHILDRVKLQPMSNCLSSFFGKPRQCYMEKEYPNPNKVVKLYDDIYVIFDEKINEIICRNKLQSITARAILVNSSNCNLPDNPAIKIENVEKMIYSHLEFSHLLDINELTPITENSLKENLYKELQNFTPIEPKSNSTIIIFVVMILTFITTFCILAYKFRCRRKGRLPVSSNENELQQWIGPIMSLKDLTTI